MIRQTIKVAWLVLAAIVTFLAAAAGPSSAVAAPTFSTTFVDQAEPFRVGDRGSSTTATIRNVGPDPADVAVKIRVEMPEGVTLRNLSTPTIGFVCEVATAQCARSTAWPVNQAVALTMRVAISETAPRDARLSVETSDGGSVTAATGHDIVIEPFRPFGVHDFIANAFDDIGGDYTQAGGQSYEASTSFFFNRNTESDGTYAPVEDVRQIVTELPVGFIGNPQAVEECTEEEMTNYLCPPESQVGIAEVDLRGSDAPGSRPGRASVYRIKPQPGYPAEFGFSIVGIGTVYLFASLRSDDDFGINVTVRSSPSYPRIQSALVTLWGEPADPRHDSLRCANHAFFCIPSSSSAPPTRFLTLPSECTGESAITVLKMDSWQKPGIFKRFEAAAPPVTDCDKLTFEPAVDIEPTTTMPDAPTGLGVDMSFPTEDNDEGLAPAPLKKAVVTMPEGMTINPSAANGLAGCTDEELNLKSKEPVTCPDAAKIGSVEATTPLLEETLSGGVYIRSQNSQDPESGEMFRLALVLENAVRGLSIRLPGQARVNKLTGRIETTFDNNPQLPVKDIRLKFKDGPRAPLTMPTTCGSHTIETVLTSWGGQAHASQSTVDVSCNGGRAGFSPQFEAGMQSPVAGESSPFTLRVVRPDADRELKSIRSIRLPEGLLGDVSSVPLCDENLAAFGACPEESRVGRVEAAVGPSVLPLWVPQAGKEPTGVYLTGPYRGAPYGLSIKVPAQAGPFDLGRVVVRSSLHVDERTAAISSGVDETRLIDPDGTVSEVLPADLPRILKGVVLDQREIRVIVDREGFMVNPTDCSQQQIAAEIHAYGGGQVDVGNRFRAADCALLGFAPRFGARILDKGRKSTLRSWHPRTRFTVVPRAGDANIGGARVALPSSTILDQGNIGTTCTRAQMAERACPAKSVVGYAKAWSPLLREVVQGPVYLAANGGVRPLPDLAAVLDGEIRVVLQGEVSTLRTGGRARLQNTFRVVPDAPVTRFELTMRGGKNRGLLVNSTDLCRTGEKGVAAFTGQNNRRSRSALRLTPSFKGCKKVRRQAARKAQQRKLQRLKTQLRVARRAARS